ncbi:helix-turn-helix domain-containing protein [Novosphingobium sp. YJ-S2-02]|uniref:Helix-turn-helix domain-containing protein n=1 Tax=Novosphingobium aureum TaxID=2792964 RepID=A0A931HF58_9SPHN|nr:IclR family transcriptional regulator C-terminal domain-containing protein [Novosphingobium aureum]MBH0114649.1 helix-turn-helix domain-containing protein [Novosphingobium aureum]
MTDPLETAVKASKAPAIARAAAILRLLGRSETPLGLQPIARELGLVPSTCLYVLRALVEEELVSLDPATKRYALGAGVLTLARHWLQRDPFASLVQPVIEEIALHQSVTCVAVEISGLERITAVAVAEGAGNFRLSTEVGSRFPALISATGRCIVAFGGHEIERLRARFEKLRWDNPPGFEQWSEQVAETRRRGYAVDEGHYIAGVTVLAAPVYRASGAPSHALIALALSRALDGKAMDGLGNALVAGAQTVTRQLGEG